MAQAHIAQCRLTLWLHDKGLMDRVKVTVPASLARLVSCLKRNFPDEFASWGNDCNGKQLPSAEIVVQFCWGFEIPIERKRSWSQKHIAEVNRLARLNRPDKYPAHEVAAARESVAVVGDAFLQSYEWRKLRMQAIQKYGRICQCCGASPANGAVLNVDHIKPRRIYPELALSLDNLQVLCPGGTLARNCSLSTGVNNVFNVLQHERAANPSYWRECRGARTRYGKGAGSPIDAGDAS